MSDIPLTIGSWVKSPRSPGVWRVFRTIERHNEYSPATRTYGPSMRQLAFSTRFLTARGAPRFVNEVADASLLEPLTASELADLEAYAAAHPDDAAAFEAFPREPPDLIHNMALSLPQDSPALVPAELIVAATQGLTYPELRAATMASAVGAFLGSRPQTHTLQWVSRGHELRWPDFVYREVRLLA
jgi:hypothetical protein